MTLLPVVAGSIVIWSSSGPSVLVAEKGPLDDAVGGA
jgi:hypothetical protein